MDLLPIFPRDNGPIATTAEVLESQRRTTFAIKPSACDVVFCEETDSEVVNLVGPEALIEFVADTELPRVVFHIFDMDMFFSLSIDIEDTQKRISTLRISNKQTVVKADVVNMIVELPLVLVKGWNRISLDLRDLAKKCLGVHYAICKNITINSNVRLGRIYFEDEEIPDNVLPKFLRAIPE
eukprot:TRINITY_DN6498_c0_g4_i1.p1 TRINITY_DN6498_c0_g4~~TRINITY_DN6498_c0_g4_i1.p1  ORF type:complete len:182 (-),score=25.98 TRINITY_DN6498_c0_g4_i1:173-718(-)